MKGFEVACLVLSTIAGVYADAHSFQTHPSLRNIAKRAGQTTRHSLPLIEFDGIYLTTIQIGSKGKNFSMQVDTSSSYFYVPYANCKRSGCAGRATLGPKDSTSLNVTQHAFSLDFSSAIISGVVVEDTLNFAGFSIPRMSIGGADVYSAGLNEDAWDGNLGLGSSSGGNVNGLLSVMDELGMTGQLPIDNLLFGIYLKETASANGGTGEISFGSPNTDLFVGTLKEVPNLSQQGAWEAPVDDVQVNGVAMDFKDKTAAIDTSSSWIQLTIADATKIHTALTSNFFQTDGMGNFSVPCSIDTELEFVLGGVGYRLNPSSYVDTEYVTWTFQNGTKLCLSLMLGIDGQDPIWLFGTPFLMNVYTVFNIQAQTISFAPSVQGEL
jgi:hypothetical protein